MTAPADLPGPDVRMEVNIPPELEAGQYANFASIWRDNDGFILDFAVNTRPPAAARDETGAEFLHLSARVVSRVRIPYSQAWEFMKGLTTQLGEYEAEHAIGHPNDSSG